MILLPSFFLKDHQVSLRFNFKKGKNKKNAMGPMRFELMTSRLSAGRTTWLCYGPDSWLDFTLITTPPEFL